MPAGRARVRGGPGLPWRVLADLCGERPLELRPGDPTEIAVDGAPPAEAKELTVRLELQSTAIPPLVWLEFTDTLRGENVA